MLDPRFLQNFNGFTAHLVVADRHPVEMLETTLRKLGVDVEWLPLAGGRAVLPERPLSPERDILVVDGDLDAPLGTAGDPSARLLVPVIGLVGVETPGRLKALMQIGATAVLRKPVHGAVVYSALFVGMNGFLHRRRLEERIADSARRRHGRRFVIKAIVAVMRQTGVDDDEAYAILRRTSMRERLSLEDYCEAFVGRSEAKQARPDGQGRQVAGTD